MARLAPASPVAQLCRAKGPAHDGLSERVKRPEYLIGDCRQISQCDYHATMKTNLLIHYVMALLLAFGRACAQPVLVNPSFETDITPPYPGYGTITGWLPDEAIGTGYGLNEEGGPFADNGKVPNGARVAFMQDNGTLSQTVAGFTPGEQYWLVYRENARGLCCGERRATLSARIGGTTVVAEHEVAIVGGSNPFHLVTSDAFTAAEAEMTLSFTKGGIGDSTALIDDVRLLSRGALQLAISVIDGSVPAIRIQGIPGRMLTLEFKHSLVPEGLWQPLANLLLTNGSDVFVDSEAPISNPRFYRAWQP